MLGVAVLYASFNVYLRVDDDNAMHVTECKFDNAEL